MKFPNICEDCLSIYMAKKFREKRCPLCVENNKGYNKEEKIK